MDTRRTIEFFGLLAGLATICALFVAVIQLIQSVNAQIVSDRTQAGVLAEFGTSIANQATSEVHQLEVNANLSTQVALQEKQVGIQQTMVAAQSGEPQSAPTATALAQTVALLAKTSEAIETQRRLAQSTQTALARPTATTFVPTSTPAPAKPYANSYRPRSSASIGTGVFANVSISDGMANLTDTDLATNYSRLQQMNVNITPDGCGVAEYQSSELWFGSTQPTRLLVNNTVIGEYGQYAYKGSQGVLLNWQVSLGDRICVELKPGILYHVNLGPDIDIHYDSYCYRGHC